MMANEEAGAMQEFAQGIARLNAALAAILARPVALVDLRAHTRLLHEVCGILEKAQ